MYALLHILCAYYKSKSKCLNEANTKHKQKLRSFLSTWQKIVLPHPLHTGEALGTSAMGNGEILKDFKSGDKLWGQN